MKNLFPPDKLPECMTQSLSHDRVFWMKLSITFLLFSLLGIQLMMAYPGYGQGLEDETITLEVEGKYLPEVLKEIEKQTDYRFAYNASQIQNYQVDLVQGKRSLQATLELILAGKPLQYKVIRDKFIVLNVIPVREPVVVPRISTRTIPSRVLSIPPLDVEGQVSDHEGKPLIGVNILVKGTNRGTSTDFDGRFILEDVDENAVLVVSYVGYQTQEVPVAGKSNINIRMITNSQLLDEVVVVGYGTQKKSDVTGAVSSVSSSALAANPLTRVDQALQGKAAGVQIINTDGAPGGNVKIRIRGANSLKGSNNPLVVIDGFFGGNLDDLNPSEIESIEVLKDASATAIYGALGANGVILVTTKRGKEGPPEVTLDVFNSMQNIRNEPGRVSPYEYGQLVNRRENIFGRPNMFSDSQLEEFKTTGVDYPGLILRTAHLHNYQLSLQGGGESVKYFVAGHIVDHKGIVINSDYRSYSLRTNMDLELSEKLSAFMNLSADNSTNHSVRFNGYQGTPIYNAYVYAPILPVYDEEGNYVHENPNYGPLGQANPVAMAVEPIRDKFNTKLYGYGGFNYQIAKGLSVRISGGVKKTFTNNNLFFNQNTDEGMEINSSSTILDGNTLSWQNTNQITYDGNFSDKHKLNVTAVFEQLHSESRANSVNIYDFISNSLAYYNLSLAQGYPELNQNYNAQDIHSFLGRVNYSYANKYLATASFRADGSSKFGKGNRWATFPSVSLAWKLSNEEWLQSLNIFSSLKLRLSYGETGSQAAPAYASLQTLAVGWNYPFDGQTPSVGVGPGGIANPNLKWETTTQKNVGVDMYWFNNRLGVTYDMYWKNTTDLLLGKQLPLYTGTRSFTTNIGEFENVGYEISLTAIPISSEFTWQTNFNFSHNETQAIDLGEDEYLDFGVFRLYSGGKTGEIYALDFLGTWKTSEAEEAEKYGNKPGDFKYNDLNNDGVIDLTNDRKIIGNTQPKFILGFSNTMSYRSFDLNMLINGMLGYDIYNTMRAGMNSLEYIPTHADALNMWTPENETDVPVFSRTSKFTQGGGSASSRWLEEGTFVRLKNITLGYSLPPTVLNRLKLNSARVYVGGENLITLTDYSGFDPELTSSTSDVSIGTDYGSYPTSKIVTIGIQIKF